MFTWTCISASSWRYACLSVITHFKGFAEERQGSTTFYFSWRVMQLYLAAAGVFQFCWMFIYLPETAQPGTRGIDGMKHHHSRIIFINPLRPLALLRSPNLLFIVSQISLYVCSLIKFQKSLIVSSSLMNFFRMFSFFFSIRRI